MSKSIRLHPKFGVNPTIPTCFWCGKSKNEVALLGAACKTDAPQHMVLDYEPCEACAAEMAKGITLIEVSETRTGNQAPIRKSPDLYPTGAFAVVREEAIANVFGENTEEILKHRKAFVEIGVLQKIIPKG